MDTIVTLAIVGTGQAGTKQITTGTPIDALAEQLSGSVERKLLLVAGAMSIYQQAGKLAMPAPDAPQIAEPEDLASTRFNSFLLTKVLNERLLLLEAAKRMQQAHLRLPYELLPTALTVGAQAKEVRAALAPILGKRGRWLAQFNPGWSWITQYLEETGDRLPDNAEAIWQEGTQGQRCEILQRLRASDPAEARKWLDQVWKEEKAETRSTFLKTFEVGLSLEDEPFLEQALDDRSMTTRATAVSLLACLPLSALVQRMQERADTMLDYENKNLTVTPPSKVAIDQRWKRDGINVDSPHVIGESATALKQVLTVVPPRHWEERFRATPTQLIDALSRSDWELEVIENWTYAALRHNDTQWIAPLLDWYHQRALKESSTYRQEIERTLFAALPQQDAERLLLSAIAGKQDRWMHLLASLSHPWSEDFSNIYLTKMREFIHTLPQTPQYNYQLMATLTSAAFALPPTCFNAALQAWEEPDEAKRDWLAQQWQQAIEKFTDIITLRKRIIEEIV